MNKVNVRDKLAQIDDTWSPRIAGELNGQHVKLVRLKGEFVWHHHEDEDELFYVVKGRLLMRLRDGDITLDEGEFLNVPRGVAHQLVGPPARGRGRGPRVAVRAGRNAQYRQCSGRTNSGESGAPVTPVS